MEKDKRKWKSPLSMSCSHRAGPGGAPSSVPRQEQLQRTQCAPQEEQGCQPQGKRHILLPWHLGALCSPHAIRMASCPGSIPKVCPVPSGYCAWRDSWEVSCPTERCSREHPKVRVLPEQFSCPWHVCSRPCSSRAQAPQAGPALTLGCSSTAEVLLYLYLSGFI